MKILLGFEVGTGEPVYIDPDHLLETGLTQQSGKTTALNALISRSKRRAIAFRTKRGEIDWRVAKHLQPFYTQPKQRGGFIDWEYVESILEAHLGERVKFERRWIMQVCEGAKDLRAVYANSLRLEKESKHFFDKGQFYLLSNYFERLLVQLEARVWATTLPLVEGVNLMDLEDVSFEMQCLVIERVMDYVLTKMRDVIIVLPEARTFIPLSAKTPVTKTAVKVASEGAVLEVDLWVDSQTYSSINSEVRKQCGTQLHGVQMDNNEAKTITDLLDKKWKPRKLKALELGHFFVKTKDKRYKHVYVLPAGIEEEVGIAVAKGTLRVEEVKSMLMDLAPPEVEKAVLKPKARPNVEIDETGQNLNKLLVERDDANDRALELEGKLHRLEVDRSDERLKLESRIEDLQEKIQNTDAQEKAYRDAIDALQKEKAELESTLGSVSKELEDHKRTIESLNKELSQFTAFKILLASIISPQLEFPQVSDEELKKIKKDIAELKKPAVRRRRAPVEGDTGIAWIDIWLPKLNPAEAKILRFMAQKFPLQMTKSEVAIGIGLTTSGGYFNGAFNKLRKNKLIVAADGDNFKLRESPP